MPKRSLIDIGLPPLDDEIIVKIAELAEKSVREFIVSKIGKENVYDIDLTVRVEYEETLDVSFEIDLSLSPLYSDMKDVLEDEAIKYAFSKIENMLRAIANGKRKHSNNAKEGKTVS